MKTRPKRPRIHRFNLCAFTLIEIMVVAVLVGLLSAIALPNFVRTRTTARTDTCINNLRAIEYAIEQWALEANKDGSAAVEFSDISPYLKRATICPAGGTTFANSYLVSLVSEQPVCQKVPLAHLLPGQEVVTTTPSPSQGGGGPAPTGPSGNGNGNGNGGGNGNSGQGNGAGGGKGHKSKP